jgi:hypothetical protein
LTINDLAPVLESCNGEIEEKKYSDADAADIFRSGVEKGIEEGRAERQRTPPEFYDVSGQPRLHEIALFCQRNLDRLRSDWEKGFTNDMAGTTLVRPLTPKQSKYLLAIFVKLGGLT